MDINNEPYITVDLDLLMELFTEMVYEINVQELMKKNIRIIS